MYTGIRFRFEHKSLIFSETFEVFLVFLQVFIHYIRDEGQGLADYNRFDKSNWKTNGFSRQEALS